MDSQPDSVPQTPVDDLQYQDQWIYSINVEPVGQDGLLSVWVTVGKAPQLVARPRPYTLVRWMIDPQTLETTEDGYAAEGSY